MEHSDYESIPLEAPGGIAVAIDDAMEKMVDDTKLLNFEKGPNYKPTKTELNIKQ